MSSPEPKILLVDDDEAVLSVTGGILSGYLSNELVLSCDAEHAVELLKRESFGVVLSDLYMPKLSGDVVLKCAHKINSATVGILVTARATKEVVIDGMNKGYIWKCIEKPWLPADLVAMAKEALAYHARQLVVSAAQATPPPRVISSHKDRRIVIQKHAVKGRWKLRKAARKVKIHKKRITLNRGKDQSAKSDGPAPVLQDSRFTIQQRIQQGGFGCVYKAWDRLLEMSVALKILAKDMAADQNAIALLLDEARAAMQLSHKHIVRLHNIHDSDGQLCLVMEYIEGMTLREMLARDETLDLDSVMLIAQVLSDALGYAHRRGVYHRDLKPDNIMVTTDGLVKIIDFGMACMAKQVSQRDEICGTPFYMSPEEIAGDPLDQRADVYAMGVLIHELLTGELPVDGDPADLDFMEFVPVCSPDLPDPLERVLARAMAVDRDGRWPDVDAFVTALISAGQSVAKD